MDGSRLSLAIVVLCQAALSIVGYEAIHTFEKYAAIGLLVLFAVATVAALPRVDTSFANGDGASLGSFILMTTIAGSFNFAWALYASDYTRYLPASTSPGRVFGYTTLGLTLSAVWLEALGLAVTSALTSKGWQATASDPSVLVYTHVALSQQKQWTATNMGGYGYRGWGGGMATATETNIPIGTLIVDLVDSQTHEMIWRGIARDQVKTSGDASGRIQNAVTKLFEDFPPGSAAK